MEGYSGTAPQRDVKKLRPSVTHTRLEEFTVWSCVLFSCSQLPGSRGGDWLHGHDGHSARGGQAGGKRERCFAGILRNARGRGQLPVAACRETLKKKNRALSLIFFFFSNPTCLRKGPTTKLECSTTERASFVLTPSTQTVLPFFNFFLSHWVPLRLQHGLK